MYHIIYSIYHIIYIIYHIYIISYISYHIISYHKDGSLAKTGHGPHSSIVFVLFGCYLCCSKYCLCVNVYCHRVTTQLLLINISISYIIISYHIYHIIHIISYHIITMHSSKDVKLCKLLGVLIFNYSSVQLTRILSLITILIGYILSVVSVVCYQVEVSATS